MGNDRCGWLLGGGGMRLGAVLLVSLAVAACSAGTDPVGISAPERPLQAGYIGQGTKGGGEENMNTMGAGYIGQGTHRPVRDSIAVAAQ